MITCFTPIGYIRFARSLVRFCGLHHYKELSFLNQCAHANFDAYRAAAHDERTGSIQGINMDKWDEGKPYHTEVQLYKSMQSLFPNIGGTEGVALLPEPAAHLRALMNDLRERFRKSYGMEIDDERTVYSLCEETLEPELEVPVCIRSDLEFWWEGNCV